MPRSALALALVLVVGPTCDSEPEKPRGGAWQPCLENSRCSEDSLSCLQIFGSPESTACLPKCASGDMCAAGPASDNGVPTTTRCDATDTNPGRCVVDCNTLADCPADMLCLFDEVYTPITARGVCAWSSP